MLYLQFIMILQLLSDLLYFLCILRDFQILSYFANILGFNTWCHMCLSSFAVYFFVHSVIWSCFFFLKLSKIISAEVILDHIVAIKAIKLILSGWICNRSQMVWYLLNFLLVYNNVIYFCYFSISLIIKFNLIRRD